MAFHRNSDVKIWVDLGTLESLLTLNYEVHKLAKEFFFVEALQQATEIFFSTRKYLIWMMIFYPRLGFAVKDNPKKFRRWLRTQKYKSMLYWTDSPWYWRFTEGCNYSREDYTRKKIRKAIKCISKDNLGLVKLTHLYSISKKRKLKYNFEYKQYELV